MNPLIVKSMISFKNSSLALGPSPGLNLIYLGLILPK